MKTILFLSSELNPIFAEAAKCFDLYKIIYNHIQCQRSLGFLDIKHWMQPSGDELIDRLNETPNYIHYCGHGDEEGDLLINNKDRTVHSFKRNLLKAALESNKQIECVFLGSCNSDSLSKEIWELAEYTIGFTNKPSADLVIQFYDYFYADFVRYGSPYKAFWSARDKLVAQKKRTKAEKDGIVKPILKSKFNFIMELHELREEGSHLATIVAKHDSYIRDALKKLSEQEGKARTLFEELLLEHPFAIEVFEFYCQKEKLANDIANRIFFGADESQIHFFCNRLTMVFDMLEGVLVAYENRKHAAKSLRKIGNGMPADATRTAFLQLKNSDFLRRCPQGFIELFENSIAFCLDGLGHALPETN